MSYQNLIDDFQNILNRDDCSTDQAATYIKHGIQRLEREVRLPSMERVLVLSSVTTPGDTFLLPADVLQIIDVFVQDSVTVNPRALTHLSMRQLLERDVKASTYSYARHVGSIKLAGATLPGAVVTLVYYGNFTSLADYTQDNEVTLGFGDVAVYCGLSYAGDAYSHPSTQQWESRYQQLRDGLIMLSAELDMNGGPQSIQPLYRDPMS